MESAVSEFINTGKSMVLVGGGLVAATGTCIAALSLLLNLIRLSVT